VNTDRNLLIVECLFNLLNGSDLILEWRWFRRWDGDVTLTKSWCFCEAVMEVG
jgi:hypothetical protein